jgi:hypothetical protein
MSIVDDITDCVIVHYDTRFHANNILSDRTRAQPLLCDTTTSSTL